MSATSISLFSLSPSLSVSSSRILIIIMATALPPVQISSAEAAYLSGGIVSGIRGDGRGAADVRSIAIATGVLPSASGSGEARMAGAHVMVGVKVRRTRRMRAQRREREGSKSDD